MGHNLSIAVNESALIVRTTGDERGKLESPSLVLRALENALIDPTRTIRIMSSPSTKLFSKLNKNICILKRRNGKGKIAVNDKENTDYVSLISASNLTMLNSKWKFSLYMTLINCDLVSNLEIPFDILHLILLNCEGTMRNCNICDNEVLDLRFTKGCQTKKFVKKEMKRFRFVLCCKCQEKVMASYEKVDKNLESMGMKGI